MLTILLVVLVLMLLGVVPAWPHSRGWGYYPSGGLGIVLLVLIVLLQSGWLQQVRAAPADGRQRAHQSCRTTLINDGLTFSPSLPYSMSPSFRNLFMKKFTRDRVVPTISASVSCETCGSLRSGWPWP